MRIKSFAGDVKANIKKRIIEGDGNVSGIKDSHGDVIREGAFSECLADPKHAARLKHLWQHRWWEPIGVPKVNDDARLSFVSKIARTPRGDEALILADEGVVKDISIGFNPIDEGPGKLDGEDVNFITKGILWELSSVTWGSNDESVVTDVRNFLGLPTPAEERTHALTLSALVTARYLEGISEMEQRAFDVLIKAELGRQPLDADALKCARPALARAIKATTEKPEPESETKADEGAEDDIPEEAWGSLRSLRASLEGYLKADEPNDIDSLIERFGRPVQA